MEPHWGALGVPWGSPGGPWGVPGGSLGAPQGVPGVLLGAQGPSKPLLPLFAFFYCLIGFFVIFVNFSKVPSGGVPRGPRA